MSNASTFNFFSQENNKSLGWYHAFLGQINAINHNCEDISVAGLSGLIAFPHLFLVFVFVDFVCVVLLLILIWVKILFLLKNKLLARLS